MSAYCQFLKRRFLRRLASGSVIALGLMWWSSSAFAYRPFDGTDAAVAAPEEVEIELQPAGRLREGGGTSLVAPATVFNYGLSEGWEAVLEGQGQTPLSPSGPTSLTAAGAFLKHVLQSGSLQDKTGPSVATEFGMLLPDSTGNSGIGASLAGIVSQRWDWGTIHLNAETALTRDHHADVFLGGIIEGPSKWSIRPLRSFFMKGNLANPRRYPVWSGSFGASVIISASTSGCVMLSPTAIRSVKCAQGLRSDFLWSSSVGALNRGNPRVRRS